MAEEFSAMNAAFHTAIISRILVHQHSLRLQYARVPLRIGFIFNRHELVLPAPAVERYRSERRGLLVSGRAFSNPAIEGAKRLECGGLPPLSTSNKLLEPCTETERVNP
jgi:hypothetical protein